jgi:hypothetical protein
MANLAIPFFDKGFLPMPSSEGPAEWLTYENGTELDDGLFRAHFHVLPGVGYIWKRTAHGDFQLIARNPAATLLNHGDV